LRIPDRYLPCRCGGLWPVRARRYPRPGWPRPRGFIGQRRGGTWTTPARATAVPRVAGVAPGNRRAKHDCCGPGHSSATATATTVRTSQSHTKAHYHESGQNACTQRPPSKVLGCARCTTAPWGALRPAVSDGCLHKCTALYRGQSSMRESGFCTRTFVYAINNSLIPSA
jgi:hypothetical protein